MKDFLLNENGDLNLTGGDITIGRSNEQQQQLCLVMQKGSIKQYPAAGVGIENFLNGDNADDLLIEIRTQFVKDGMKVNSVAYDENTKQLSYDANYED